jgi:hypothetical protein
MADQLIERTEGAGAEALLRDMSFEPPPLMRRFLCGLAQAAVLPILLTLTTAQWLGIFVTYLLLTARVSASGRRWEPSSASTSSSTSSARSSRSRPSGSSWGAPSRGATRCGASIISAGG